MISITTLIVMFLLAVILLGMLLLSFAEAKTISAFKNKGATSEKNSINLTYWQKSMLSIYGPATRKCKKIFNKTAKGKYWLNLEELAEFNQQRVFLLHILITLIIVVFIFLYYLIVTRFNQIISTLIG